MKLTGRGVFYMSSATTVLGRRGEGERIERGENGERVRCQEHRENRERENERERERKREKEERMGRE